MMSVESMSLLHENSVITSGSPIDRLVSSNSHNKRYVCEQCGKRYTAKRELVTHRRIHQGQPTFRCFRCDKEFGTQQLLRKHEVWHTGERNHVCSQCGKAFFQKGHLTQHMMIHNGGRPHACLVCSKTFIFKFDLNRHLKTHGPSKGLDGKIARTRHTARRFSGVTSAQAKEAKRPNSLSTLLTSTSSSPTLSSSSNHVQQLRDANLMPLRLPQFMIPPVGFSCIFCAHYQQMMDSCRKRIEQLEHLLRDKEAQADKLSRKLLGAYHLLDSIIEACSRFDYLWTNHTRNIAGQLHCLLCSLK
ncbi:zinc finger, C2H2 type [Trichuris suis]|nr:zinc finger, C2H2 type [Trichuris suis]